MAGSRRRSLHLSLQIYRDARSRGASLHRPSPHVVSVLLAVSAQHLPEALNLRAASPSPLPSTTPQEFLIVPSPPAQNESCRSLFTCCKLSLFGRPKWEPWSRSRVYSLC